MAAEPREMTSATGRHRPALGAPVHRTAVLACTSDFLSHAAEERLMGLLEPTSPKAIFGVKRNYFRAVDAPVLMLLGT